MNLEQKSILTINSGSSSIKFALFDFFDVSRIFYGKIDRIGMNDTFLEYTDTKTDTYKKIPVSDIEPIVLLANILQEYVAIDSLVGIGHRIVHGGMKYQTTTRVDASVIEELERITSFAPQHLPQQLKILNQCLSLFADIPQYACFDTSFYKDLPRLAQILPLPRKFEAEGIRRYGFHGLSYEYLMQNLEKVLHEPIEKKRIILAHLGSGSSLTAVKNGLVVDTSMGFSPNSGVSMGTRTGDLDPGIFKYLTETYKLTPGAFDHIVNFESGLLGISESTADMQILLQNASSDSRAEEAVAFYCYQIQKYIGALASAMGGLDIIVFSGGIGEKSSEIRRRICTGLEFLNIGLDKVKNSANETCVSDDNSCVILYMIPTDEESIIAQHLAKLS